MSNKIKRISQSILKNIGGEENIITFENCMTRLRVKLKDPSLVNKKELEETDGIMGVVESGSTVQVVVGPGTANKVSDEIRATTSIKVEDVVEIGDAAAVKKQAKDQYQITGEGFNKIAQIFMPLIPAFIGSGLIMGINNILQLESVASKIEISPNITGLLAAFSGAVFGFLAIMVGMTAAKVFGSSIAIGGLMGGITISPVLEGVELFGKPLVPGRGGIISVLLVVWFASWVEKKLRKVLPDVLELILNPLLTILIGGFAAVLVLQPLGGFIADGIGNGVTKIIETGGPITGALLGGTFLPLVMLGLHQGLSPIHQSLIDSYGVTTLLPILAMAGAGQVGASFAVYMRTKNQRLKKTAASALPVGVLGIGEPLIYGVTLPLGKPFIGACIGGAVGGAIVAPFKVGAISMGVSGLPLALLIEQGAGKFLLGIVGAYVGGFIATLLLGWDDPVDE